MHRSLVTGSLAGLVAAGLACLAWGGWSVWRTRRFVSQAVRAEGKVFYADGDDSNRLLVEIRGPGGQLQRRLPVSIAWWTPPWCCNRGDTVGILYDPHGDFDAPLLGDAGRIDSWMQLWSGSVFWCSAGAILVFAGAANAAFRRRLRFSAGLGVRVEDRS